MLFFIYILPLVKGIKDPWSSQAAFPPTKIRSRKHRYLDAVWCLPDIFFRNMSWKQKETSWCQIPAAALFQCFRFYSLMKETEKDAIVRRKQRKKGPFHSPAEAFINKPAETLSTVCCICPQYSMNCAFRSNLLFFWGLKLMKRDNNPEENLLVYF